ncbi:MAG: BRO-N domain-containing protein [Paracoccaceae bacterium]
MNALTFHDTTMTIIERGGAPWMPGPEIGAALGYEDPAASIRQSFERHRAEFTEQMTTRIKLGRVGETQRITRVFSPRGALLLAMHAQTDRAVAFRAWVLDVLEGKVPLPGFEDRRIAMAQAILDHHPRWKAHRRYRGMGLTLREVAKLTDVSLITARRDAADLRRLGLEVAQ